METFAADTTFPFSALVLSSPRPVQGGAHFTQASLGPGRPVYVQLPRCTLKQGIVTTKRACYCDLMYDKGQAEGLITWLLALEGAAQDQIYKRRETWFHNDLSRDDVESMLTPMSRLYRSGRSLLIRASLRTDKATGAPKCTAYDEREAALDATAIDADATVIPLVLIDGVKFSARSFEIEVRLVQLMVLDPQPEPATACLIKHAPIASLPPLGRDTAAKTMEDTNVTAEATKMTAVPSPVPSPPVAAAAPAPAVDPPESETDPVHVLEAAPAPASEHSTIEAIESESESDDESSAVSEPETPVATANTPDAQDTPEGPDAPSGLEEVEIGVSSDAETMELRKPDDVYRDIYRAARRKARQMRRAAVEALLEAQKIKTQYMLDDLDDSDEEDDDALATA